MRDIRFRAWHKKRKKMFALQALHFNPGVDGEWQAWYDDLGGDQNEVVLMQFTGLKDKNGKEIFEGDIYLPKDGVKRIIEFRDGCFTEKNSFPTTPINQEGEVIGNIYSNPELLEKQ